MSKKLNILLLSSLSPYQSANLGLDIITALEKAGHRVDSISKYKFDNMHPNMYSAYDHPQPIKGNTLRYRIKRRLLFFKHLKQLLDFRKKTNITIVNKSEQASPIDSSLITAKIQQPYDLVITLFWQGMINTQTLKQVYDKVKCPIFIHAVDMAPLTGGCVYFWDCKQFQTTCGRCPGLHSQNPEDQSHTNFLLKKQIYAATKAVFIGNSWMRNKALGTDIFEHSRIKEGGMVINQDSFLNRDKTEARELLGLPAHKFILFAGAANIQEYRKGGNLLTEAINDFASRLSAKQRSEVLLLYASRQEIPNIQRYFSIALLGVGFLDTEKLALTYAASDLYLSPSIQDAGPSMVNQALMCGTPVVAFQTGVALDVVITHQTGYCAEYKNTEDYSKGISYIYSLDKQAAKQMSAKCREIALKYNSFESFASRIERIYTEVTP